MNNEFELSIETKIWIQLKKIYQLERCKIRKILNMHQLTKSHFDVLLLPKAIYL